MSAIKHFILFLFLISSSILIAQNKSYRIEGIIVDKTDKTPLESATVYLQGIKDSTVISYTTANAKGDFSLTGKTKEEEIFLYVSFIGYKNYSKKISHTDKLIQLDTLFLESADNLLNEVVIKSNAPILVKKDTIEFNPNSFQTKKDATVEDFLKKLPGVEVSTEGAITINGVSVDKILVNGKPFFGDDPKIALENLTKDMINKIQVTDTKTKSEAFTGEAGEKTNKTINITIKKEHNRGLFGRVSAGKGTQNRQNYNTNVNLFDNISNLSFIASGNNRNQKELSNGLKNNSSNNRVGANFSTKYKKLVDFQGSYSLNTSDSERGSIIDRENILPDFHYFSKIQSNSGNESKRHRMGIDTDFHFGKNILLTFNPTFNFNNSTNHSTREEISTDENGALINSSNASNRSNSESKNVNTRITMTKKIGTDGGYLRIRFTNTINQSDGDNFTNSETRIFGNNPSNIDRNQLSKNKTESNSINTNISYRLPLLSKKLFLNLGYGYSQSKNKNERNTYDFDAITDEFNQFNTDLSTQADTYNKSNWSNVQITYRLNKWYTKIAATYRMTSRENNDFLRPQYNLKDNFNALDYNANIRYNPSKKSNISLSYNLRNSNPSLSQLNPFQDISNPLNIVSGNPDLATAKNHSFRLNFNSYNTQKKTSFYSNASFNFQENRVVSKTSILDDFVRYTSYTNVNGNFQVSAYTGFNKTYKFNTNTTLRYNINLSTNYNKSINYSNGNLYNSKNTSLSPNFGITFTWKDVIDISPRYRVSMNTTTFDLASFTDKDFVNHSASLRTRVKYPEKLEWSNNISYLYNSAITGDLPKATWTWDTTISYSILKDQGLISLTARDLLNQNNNINRTATDNYIQYSQSPTNTQNITLSFRWKFNSRKKNKA
ncbi:hypothetical protein GCM10011416_04500 [Polaribacter pacificus]|uniref:Outer membrane protein beta-barrel domain-containing protein n=1 Tax=Polaribacter pacificus TaxID=1775173 RepID=A0A917HUF8_9FLAO|nr:outer membrane beta-barrel protein [Polaribacter pacificus]GGG91061.1 hypothetical protein GCM10011416_04500 [Polaribacter pacificus]